MEDQPTERVAREHAVSHAIARWASARTNPSEGEEIARLVLSLLLELGVQAS
jgi:hypothetical protein